MSVSRRDFLRTAAAAGVGAAAAPYASAFESVWGASSEAPQRAPRPVVIASGNGLRAVEKAMQMILEGADALDAVIAGVNLVEDDPEDMTVGLGGLPNERGEVELDASVMHGPTHRAGAVAALKYIRNPSKVARLVMERTDHVLLVGEGALQFALMHGFKKEELLTEKARLAWVQWKETLSNRDDYLPPHGPQDRDIGEELREVIRYYGTISCLGLDLRGNLSGVTTTSGLAFKIPGRVGDSPIIGAGLYVDNEVGAAGSTGRGEANLVNCSCVFIVEQMRAGRSPEEACLEACKRIVQHNKMRRLQDEQGRPNFNVRFYAINKAGQFGSAEIWRSGKFALHDGTQARLLDCAYLYERR
ncbi:MAG: N(4)-(beta-N-acetylglucosaminyl)-L-asparaginase [Bacteroidetes bacterium]|nr:N(4)-(beta-N-acetylglucosaminyl)-L-asparaginase [Rhodothermia bacterium]MCS7154233.1 N(4)-(beta-N-acetylglucosaminyl)-L-asparaginase [Bacteroidota bacterium]MCX7906731.1 N(4)-(beta-N-acetylglucosaminyl)-L-asparaginase [Bacteroidota bacterium]MDW8136989.1 N(4)-(beta-N-acetylglucosaminyl)-L-asparaginase [Bacteroidota bacterium]MDW8285140.1 N(4)-(beta-N-acetylglucosaminyl)-L-asparaginase [Bacteroidota bacterium]